MHKNEEAVLDFSSYFLNGGIYLYDDGRVSKNLDMIV